jgi:palmitoyltransferase
MLQQCCDQVLDYITPVLYGLKWFAESLVRLLGPVFVLFATTLITSVIFVFFKAILPYHTPLFSFTGICHLIIDLFLIQGWAYNYFMCIFTPPGSPPPLREEDVELYADLQNERVPKRGEGFSRWCKICKQPKPKRTHHCHVCKACVLRMDHHCPWVSNCVGHYNHRYFFLFLLYMWLGCIYVGIMSWAPFCDITNFHVPWKGMSSRSTIMFVFVMTVAVGVAVSLMLGWHLYLVLTGQTTIEFYFNRYKAQQAKYRGEIYQNEFDLGIKKNWELFFGKGRYWFSFLFPYCTKVPGDGQSFPTRADLRSSAFFV